jgi:hypothetical protein
MASEILGLFGGQSPQQLRNAFLDSTMVSPQQMAQQGLLQQVVSMGQNAGSMMGAGAGRLFGGKVAGEVEASYLEDSLAQVEKMGFKNDAEKMAALGDLLATKPGMGRQAMLARQEAEKLKPKDTSMSLLKDFTTESVAKFKKTKNVKDLVRYTPADKAKISTYGQQLIDQGLTPGTASFNEAMAAWNKAELAGKAPKPEAKSAFEKQMDSAGITDPAKRQAMAARKLELDLKANQGDPTALAALNLMAKQLDIQIAQQKIAKGEKEDSAAEAAQKRKNKADAFKAAGIINTIDTALSQVGGGTAGLGGVIMKKLAGSEAVDLEANLETIQANLGFDQLQAMRDASPTGGALGQVSERELIALQSTVASLKQEQSPEQLRANINKIKKHYQNWLDTLNGINPDERDAAEAKAKAEQEQARANRVVPNAEDSALVNKYLK